MATTSDSSPSHDRSPPLATVAKDVFRSGKYSDITIFCGSRSWRLHKVVLCTRSDFFRKAMDGSFKEGRECCINLKEDQPNAVAAMLYWLYHNEYSESGLRPPDWSRETFHTEVYVLADKYVLHGLRQEAKTKLEKVVENNWACSSFPDLVEDLYRDYADDNGHSDHELLRLVKAVAVRHAKELFAPGPKYAYFKEVSRRINGFATDVLAAHLVTGGSKSLPQSSAISMQPTVRYRCPGCHATFSQPAIDHLEFYTHLCMQMANAQRWRAPMSGASWQRHTVHSMEDSDDESL